MKKNIFKIFVSIIVILLMIPLAKIVILSILLRPDVNTFEFKSDDNQYTLVIKEESVLLSGQGRFFKKSDYGSLIEKGSYTTDDGFEPFTHNAYQISWDGSVVSIDFSFGSGGSTKRIVLDLSSNDKTYINDKFIEKELE